MTKFNWLWALLQFRRTDPRNVMRQDRKVMRLAGLIANMVLQQRFGAKAQALEQHHGTDLVGRHLRDQLLDAALQRDRVDRLEQIAPEPGAALVGRDEQADF